MHVLIIIIVIIIIVSIHTINRRIKLLRMRVCMGGVLVLQFPGTDNPPFMQ